MNLDFQTDVSRRSRFASSSSVLVKRVTLSMFDAAQTYHLLNKLIYFLSTSHVWMIRTFKHLNWLRRSPEFKEIYRVLESRSSSESDITMLASGYRRHYVSNSFAFFVIYLFLLSCILVFNFFEKPFKDFRLFSLLRKKYSHQLFTTRKK